MVITLPKPLEDNQLSLEQAFTLRETKREYLNSSISLKNLSKLLHAAQGKRSNCTKLLAPSAQEQYPLTTYVVVKNVDGIDEGFDKNSDKSLVDDLIEGLYEYNNSNHSLVLKEQGHFSSALAEAAIGDQPWVDKAAVIIVLASNIQSMNTHFADQAPINQRGERYCYIEVGAVAQNIQLQGTALDIGMVLVGGFDNERVKTILTLPTELEPCALLCLGNV